MANLTKEEWERSAWNFIGNNHVLSITTRSDNDLWSASLMYVSDPAHRCLYVTSSPSTRHGQMMVKNPVISGTIAGQATVPDQIKGLQFTGLIQALQGDEAQNAIQHYQKFLDIPTSHFDTMWKILFSEYKMTDNTLGFGSKFTWKADSI